MKKLLLPLAIAIVAVIGWIAAFLAWQNTDQIQSALEESIAAVTTERDNTLQDLEDVTTELDTLSLTVEELNTDLRSAEEQVSTREAEVSSLETEITRLSDELSDMRANYLRTRRYEEIATCSLPPANINYSNNSTVSQSLKDFVEKHQGTVESAVWDVLWNNSTVAQHRITTDEYAFYFIAYLSTDNPSNSIYWVDQACFVDLGK